MAKLEEIYLDCHSVNGAVLHCPMETEIALFCLSYIRLTNVKVFILCSEDNPDACTLPRSILDELKTEIVTDATCHSLTEITACKRPVAKSNDGDFKIIHCGLCNTLRWAIRMAHLVHPDKRYNQLLGYKENFLKACAEVSPWTNFCEITLPRKIQNILQCCRGKSEPKKIESGRLIEEVVMLNNNFKQPIKIKNINKLKYKMFQESKGNDSCAFNDWKQIVLEHRFAETAATSMTITDLILFTCMHEYLMSEHWIPSAVRVHLELVYKWYLRMAEIPSVKEASRVCGFRQPMFETCGLLDCSVIVPDVSDKAVRAQEKEKKGFATHEGDVQGVLDKIEEGNIRPVTSDHPCIDDLKLDWDALPAAAHPATGELPKKRVERKCQQLENIVKAALGIAKPGDTIVDFCSGGGHVGILLAYYLPECKILLVENKEESLQRAMSRIKDLGLTNVQIYQSNLNYYNGQFNIGLCLHACGTATDMVLQKCIDCDASFVVCPCCYGFISDTADLTFPRSSKFAEAGITKQEYITLARVADQTEVKLALAERGKYCMQLIDMDRRLHAMQQGYEVTLCSLSPLSCTPKNNLLIGKKPS